MRRHKGRVRLQQERGNETRDARKAVVISTKSQYGGDGRKRATPSDPLRSLTLANESLQVSTCNVGRGLYTLRYVDSNDGRDAAPAVVRAAQGYERVISILAAPGLPAGQLIRPGSILVISSSAPALLEIAIDASGRPRVPHAQFSLELLSQGQEGGVVRASAPAVVMAGPAEHPVVQPEPLDQPPEPIRLEIIGHVSRLGDVRANPGEWIAGPSAPSPIEGLSVRCMTNGVNIEAQYVNTLRPKWWSSWQSAESIGTRQQASPLLGLRLRLSGERAAACELFAESLFLGSPIVSASGPEINVTSAAGTDPLIGLRLDLRETDQGLSKHLAQPSRSRVRVFRSSDQLT